MPGFMEDPPETDTKVGLNIECKSLLCTLCEETAGTTDGSGCSLEHDTVTHQVEASLANLFLSDFVFIVARH